MKRNNITKKDLKIKYAYNLGIPNSLSDKILNSFFDVIISGLNRDGEVKKFQILENLRYYKRKEELEEIQRQK